MELTEEGTTAKSLPLSLLKIMASKSKMKTQNIFANNSAEFRQLQVKQRTTTFHAATCHRDSHLISLLRFILDFAPYAIFL